MEPVDKRSDVVGCNPEEQGVVGVDLGIALPKDPMKPAYVAMRVTANEVFLSVDDARDVAMNYARVCEESRRTQRQTNGEG